MYAIRSYYETQIVDLCAEGAELQEGAFGIETRHGFQRGDIGGQCLAHLVDGDVVGFLENLHGHLPETAYIV